MSSFQSCPSCGKPTEGSPKFCSSCGHVLDVSPNSYGVDLDELEVVDVDLPPTKAKPKDVVMGILNGKLGLFTQIKNQEFREWRPCRQVGPYAFIMPILVPTNKQFGNLDGYTYLCSDAQKIADKNRELRQKGQFKDGGFFIPVFTGTNLDMMVPSKMFDFNNGVYAIPHFLPRVVKPLTEMTLYLIILNLSNRDTKVKISLEGKGFQIPEASKNQLQFELQAGKILHNYIRLNVTEKKFDKEHAMKVLGEATMGTKLASAVATGALSVGLSLLLGGGMFMSSHSRGRGFTAKWVTASA